MFFTNIDKLKLKDMINKKEDFLLLDIRTEEEFEASNIYGAINVPLNKLLFNLNDFEEYKNKDIVVYCRSGHRSITACNLLSMEGFDKIYNLEKGIIDYI